MRYPIFLVVGLLLLVASLVRLKAAIEFAKGAERVTGVVTSLVPFEEAYYPVFAISTKDGTDITYQHNEASYPAAWYIGEKTTFLYHPDRGSQVVMIGYFQVFGMAILLIVVALPLIIISAGYYLLNPQRQLLKQ
ncbi:DUF3592 domain-containing protein [Chitinophaga rhizophila]|uniref:DUF3592 domain-containing protein n=1 Tax=Chitinophaga rhizophila TaxID=2866212 RepID=A0ABS7G6Q6_9BACT|nr:DUF3592 domain-containing protein [Chitinophaga rhizophila]MBW8683304.1 hypothetical protein [Chitinophaga rhizophila]